MTNSYRDRVWRLLEQGVPFLRACDMINEFMGVHPCHNSRCGRMAKDYALCLPCRVKRASIMKRWRTKTGLRRWLSPKTQRFHDVV
jgi:hypothetical protein